MVAASRNWASPDPSWDVDAVNSDDADKYHEPNTERRDSGRIRSQATDSPVMEGGRAEHHMLTQEDLKAEESDGDVVPTHDHKPNMRPRTAVFGQSTDGTSIGTRGAKPAKRSNGTTLGRMRILADGYVDLGTLESDKDSDDSKDPEDSEEIEDPEPDPTGELVAICPAYQLMLHLLTANVPGPAHSIQDSETTTAIATQSMSRREQVGRLRQGSTALPKAMLPEPRSSQWGHAGSPVQAN
ncbi:hypothetical protein LTR49_022380 [Elasticomyces elasticus]|nr:hypothetical protein LTR49_022380 [Elasticomyces elasticus]